MKFDVAVNLIEKFLAGFDVKVQPRVRTVQHHDDEILMVREDMVGLERRPEEVPVLFDPIFEVGWGEKHRHGADDNTPTDRRP
jgi:hypothetical protein